MEGSPTSVTDAFQSGPPDDLTDIVSTDSQASSIGCGSRGTVYLAKMGGSKVVIKAIRGLHLSTEEARNRRKRLNREIVVFKSLDNIYVAKFLGIARGIETPFGFVVCRDSNATEGLVSPFIPNCLLEYISDHHTEKTRVAYEVALGLKYLHDSEKPIVHGDLKPANIMIDEQGTVKLIDFGLSRILGMSGFTTNLNLNHEYVAPELVPLDPSNTSVQPTTMSDIFSLGKVYYHIFNSCPNRQVVNRSRPDLVKLHSGERPRRNSRALKELPHGLWDLICDCWGPLPKVRPDISEVVERVEYFLY